MARKKKKTEDPSFDLDSPGNRWFGQGLTQIHDRFDRIEERFDNRIDRFEERFVARLDKLGNRIGGIEKLVWVAVGGVVIGLAILGYIANLARSVLLLWLQQLS